MHSENDQDCITVFIELHSLKLLTTQYWRCPSVQSGAGPCDEASEKGESSRTLTLLAVPDLVDAKGRKVIIDTITDYQRSKVVDTVFALEAAKAQLLLVCVSRFAMSSASTMTGFSYEILSSQSRTSSRGPGMTSSRVFRVLQIANHQQMNAN